MAKKKSASPDDNNHKKRKKALQKKELTLKPPHAKDLQKQIDDDRKQNDDILRELVAKTAALADQIKGKDTQEERVLQLDEPTGKEPVDIFGYLESESEPKPADDTQETDNAEIQQPKATPTKSNPAVELIRGKLDRLYGKEPDAAEEVAESIQAGAHRSKHQAYMYDLTTSGKSLADIQTQWHNYYVGLPDDEKHEVWQEFYKNQQSTSAYVKALTPTEKQPEPEQQPQQQDAQETHTPAAVRSSRPFVPNNRSVADVRARLLSTISAGGRLKAKDHLKSALFGLTLAAFVGLAFSFTFFNEVFIAPFISPSRSVSATPILGNLDEPVGPESKIIIPKINLEVPVVFDLGTVAEANIQNALEDGVVHYAASPDPGEVGNSVIVGHSSNNILNAGKYKFAFVLLNRMEEGDTFFIHKDSIRYTYKIYKNYIVEPDDVSVLGASDRANTMTLITCDPPGTSLRRRIVVAEQISPDPLTNTAAAVDVIVAPESVELPSNAPSLWSRLNPF